MKTNKFSAEDIKHYIVRVADDPPVETLHERAKGQVMKFMASPLQAAWCWGNAQLMEVGLWDCA